MRCQTLHVAAFSVKVILITVCSYIISKLCMCSESLNSTECIKLRSHDISPIKVAGYGLDEQYWISGSDLFFCVAIHPPTHRVLRAKDSWSMKLTIHLCLMPQVDICGASCMLTRNNRSVLQFQ
jgi:hypothetical protein